MTSGDERRLDPAVVAALYVEHADDLRAFLLGILRDPDSAAEALQATFTKALEVGSTSREETRKGWLFRVAFHEAMAIRRRRQADERLWRKAAWFRSPREHSPEDDLNRFEDVQRVRGALKQLPPAQQEVVRLRIYEGKTFAAIAEHLGVPLGTVLTRMRLAMTKLQRALAGEQNSKPPRGHESR